MDFIQQLWAIITDIWEIISPAIVVDGYEHGIVLRWGQFSRMAPAGLNWKWPVAEKILTARSSTSTHNVNPQSLTTKDGKNIVLSMVIKYKIVDPKVFILDVENAVDAIGDIAQGHAKQVVMGKDWIECMSNELDNEIAKKVRASAKRWGIEVDTLTIADLAVIRSIRLLSNKNDEVSVQ